MPSRACSCPVLSSDCKSEKRTTVAPATQWKLHASDTALFLMRRPIVQTSLKSAHTSHDGMIRATRTRRVQCPEFPRRDKAPYREKRSEVKGR